MNNWKTFWENETLFSDKNWNSNMSIFLQSLPSVMTIDEGDTLLDIGCGPGVLENYLQDKNVTVHAMDISEKYIELCKLKFINSPNFAFHHLGKDFLDFSFLQGKKFNKIFCISVLQYYPDLKSVEILFNNIAQHMEKGGQFLLSDICVSQMSYSTILQSLIQAIRYHYFFEQLAFIFKSRFSSYYKTLSESGILIISESELSDIANKNNLSMEPIAKPMTLNPSRKNFLFKLK